MIFEGTYADLIAHSHGHACRRSERLNEGSGHFSRSPIVPWLVNFDESTGGQPRLCRGRGGTVAGHRSGIGWRVRGKRCPFTTVVALNPSRSSEPSALPRAPTSTPRPGHAPGLEQPSGAAALLWSRSPLRDFGQSDEQSFDDPFGEGQACTARRKLP